MSYQLLKLIHVTGIFLLFLSLGGIALFTMNGGTKSSNKYRLLAAITHGLGLILLILAGFSMLKHIDISHSSLPGWNCKDYHLACVWWTSCSRFKKT